MVPNEWKYVSYVGPATNGDGGYILFIFDSMGGKNGQKAYISQPSLEIFDEKPEPLEKPSCAFCSAELWSRYGSSSLGKHSNTLRVSDLS